MKPESASEETTWTDGSYGPRQQRGNDVILADAAYLNALEKRVVEAEAKAALADEARDFFDPEWARSVVRDCRTTGVACFVKQLGGARPGNRLEDLPEDLRVRDFPR